MKLWLLKHDSFWKGSVNIPEHVEGNTPSRIHQWLLHLADTNTLQHSALKCCSNDVFDDFAMLCLQSIMCSSLKTWSFPQISTKLASLAFSEPHLAGCVAGCWTHGSSQCGFGASGEGEEGCLSGSSSLGRQFDDWSGSLVICFFLGGEEMKNYLFIYGALCMNLYSTNGWDDWDVAIISWRSATGSGLDWGNACTVQTSNVGQDLVEWSCQSRIYIGSWVAKFVYCTSPWMMVSTGKLCFFWLSQKVAVQHNQVQRIFSPISSATRKHSKHQLNIWGLFCAKIADFPTF